MSPLLDPFVRGIAVGALGITALTVWNSGVGRAARLGTVLGCVSIGAWMITESPSMWGAFGEFFPIMVLAFPVAGLFWLIVVTVFEDWPVNLSTLAPAALLMISGFAMFLIPGQMNGPLWAVRNAAGGLLSLHAAYVIVRGWRDDLVETRRRLRGIILGFAALFSAFEVTTALIHRLDPKGPWMLLAVGDLYGAIIVALIVFSCAVLFLQGRPSVFGSARRIEPGVDARAEAADRQLIGRLEAFMDAGGWRTEGLTIGAMAMELEAPEHRLRRLINQRLGHRNFADFVNSHRIEAAKRRLSDPAEARTTVAAIAFDLGYGSLGPFNRAFRAATGSTPTEWRRHALQASPNLQEAV